MVAIYRLSAGLILALNLAGACADGVAQFRNYHYFSQPDLLARREKLIAKRSELNDYTQVTADCFVRAFGWEVFRRVVSSKWTELPDVGLGATQSPGTPKGAYFSAVLSVRTDAAKPKIFESIHDNDAVAVAFARLTQELPILQQRGEAQVVERGFPQHAVSIKAFWRRVPANGTVALGVWPGIENLQQDRDAAQNENLWPECVVVYDPAKPQSGRGPCGVNPDGTEKTGDFITAEQFFTYPISAKTSIAFRQPKDAADILKPGDKMILLGMHIATKEIPDWTWSTFWWQGRGSHPEDPSKPQELSKGDSIWRNYAGTTSISFNWPATKFDKPVQASYNVIFNPYLEALEFHYGTSSSCVSCHSRAAYSRSFADLAPNNILDRGRLESVKDVEGLVKTDYIWRLVNP
jgi:hypothetical protein